MNGPNCQVFKGVRCGSPAIHKSDQDRNRKRPYRPSSHSSSTTEELLDRLSLDREGSIDTSFDSSAKIDNYPGSRSSTSSIDIGCPVLSPQPCTSGEKLMEYEKFDNYVDYLKQRNGLDEESIDNDVTGSFDNYIDPIDPEQPSTSFDLPEMSLMDYAVEPFEHAPCFSNTLPAHLLVNLDDVTKTGPKLKSKLKKSYLTKTLDNLKKKVVSAVTNAFEKHQEEPSTETCDPTVEKRSKGGRPPKMARGCKAKEKEAEKALLKEYDLVRQGVLPCMQLELERMQQSKHWSSEELEVATEVIKDLVYKIVQPPELKEKKRRQPRAHDPPQTQRELRNRRS